MTLTARIRTTPAEVLVPTTAPVVATTTALRALAGGALVPTVLLAADRDGGVFAWDSIAGRDNGGTRFNAGGLTSNTAGWRRDLTLSGGSVNALMFGARGDCIESTSTSTTASSAVVVCAGLTSADVGKVFAVEGAGTAGATLVGTILGVSGSNVTLNVTASANTASKPARWGTNDADAIQRMFNYLQAQLVAQLTYSSIRAHLPGNRRYMVHRSGAACLEMPSNVCLTGDQNTALVAASDTDIIIRMACAFNTLERIQFRHGLHAIAYFGTSSVLANEAGTPFGGSMGNPANTQSVVMHRECEFYYQRGPSVWQDTSVGGTSRVIAGHLVFDGCHHLGQTLFWGCADNVTFRNCWATPIDTYPVVWDDAREMGWVVSSVVTTFRDVSCSPFSASDTAWFEGCGHVSSVGWRQGGESPRPGWDLRTNATDLTYKSLPLPIDATNHAACVYSYADGIQSTGGHNLVRIWDEIPAVISIRRPETSGSGGARAHFPFNNPDASIWIDSDTVTTAEMYAQRQVSTEINLVDIDMPVRFVYSNDPTSQYGADVTHLFVEYQTKTNAPDIAEGRTNLWWSSGAQAFDPSLGLGGAFTNFDFANISYAGLATRQITYTADDNTGSASYSLNDTGGVKWGSGYPAGHYTISVYVHANYAGAIFFYHDAESSRATGVRYFTPSDAGQRVSWVFYYDGTNDKQLLFNIPSVPGEVPGPAGVITLSRPMINAGQEAAAYTLPGLALATGGASGDSHEFGVPSSGGRVATGTALHTSASGSAENVGTVTLAQNGVYDVTATFLGRKSTGAIFVAIRSARFKRVSGTTTQIGATGTPYADDSEASTAAWVAAIDNSSDAIRFRSTSENTATWQVDWKLEARVV